MSIIPIIILGVVFLGIAVRQVGKVRLPIWQVMLLGALGVLVTGQISPSDALHAINLDVMLFLFGMFVVGQALEDSGYLAYLAHRFFHRAKSADQMVFLILLVFGIFSAFLMNDTLAIIGTPVVLLFARKNGLPPKLLLLTLAFAVTIGSVMSPIGNPQNLLIALHGGVRNPFITFFKYLLVPTLLNLVVAYLLLRFLFPQHLNHNNNRLVHSPEPIRDARLANLSRLSLILLVFLVLAKIVTVFTHQVDFPLFYIALVSALPIILFSSQRFHILRRIDWYTLIFFAAMFVLMQSVWDAGFFQAILEATHWNLAATGVILGVSTVLSQFISNVPLVALYLPLLTKLGASTKAMVALAAGSTIAGNLSILGAASNVIIIQNAEHKSGETLTFWEFLKVGVPLTAINLAVYWVFFLVF
ncbi:MAG: anion transporter [Chloroflexota bacterium]